MSYSFLGITREPVYSPGKVADDRAILEAVVERLADRHDVNVIPAEEGLPDAAPAPIIFTMAQGPAALSVLRIWQRRGVRIINTPDAIENCHRRRMVPAFDRGGVRHPNSILIDTAGDVDARIFSDGPTVDAWLKRGDVHATEPDDVVHVTDPRAANAALKRFRTRGIATAVLQRHVPGEVIKFYAVRERFFCWFAPPEHALTLAKEEVDRMQALADHGASVLGLEVFGGDCVRRGPGDFWLIDLNDWPSYGRCRSAAADAISAYLTAQAA